MNEFITPETVAPVIERDFGIIISIPLDEYRHLVSSESRLIAYVETLEGIVADKDEAIANLNEDLDKCKSDLSIEQFLRKRSDEKYVKLLEERGVEEAE